MTCERARHFIDQYAVDELSAADARALASHVRTCAACAAEMAGVTRLVGILAALPDVTATPDFDERILAAAFADRDRRHAKRTWVADLRIQLLRGTARTTGTLVATILAVALLGATFVFAAGNFFRLPFTGGGTLTPVPTQTAAPADTGVPTPSPATVTDAPVVVPATPDRTDAPTEPPVVRPTAAPVTEPPAITPEPTPEITPAPTPEPTPEPTLAPTEQPTPQPTVTEPPSPTVSPVESATPEPSPTEKPRRTPPPSPTPTPTSP
jgi:anti-sigma factor RsiW